MAPLLALVVACGGSDGGDSGDDAKGGDKESGGSFSPEAGNGSSEPSDSSDASSKQPALSAKELEQLALEEGSTVESSSGSTDGYEVREPVMEEPTTDLMEYEADPRACQPLVGLWPGATDFTAEATVNRKVKLGDSLKEGSVDVQLRSYADGAAEGVMAALKKAGESCAGGFTEDRTLAEAPVREAKKAPLPELGDTADDGLSFRLPVEDVKDADIVFTDYLTVLRHGSVTISFRLDSKDQKDHGKVPESLIKAQLDRFQE